MKKKTYVLTVSKIFMAGHPRAGQPTHFRQQILDGKKIHTIRARNYWQKVVEEVNAGRAILSVREWSSTPYASKQVEFARYDKLGWQTCVIEPAGKSNAFVCVHNHIGAYGPIRHHFQMDGQLVRFAANDGLTVQDFWDWFNKPLFGGIIHFTDFRY